MHFSEILLVQSRGFFPAKAEKELVKWAFSLVLITNCPICNLFAKKVLMFYNKSYIIKLVEAPWMRPQIISVERKEDLAPLEAGNAAASSD